MVLHWQRMINILATKDSQKHVRYEWYERPTRAKMTSLKCTSLIVRHADNVPTYFPWTRTLEISGRRVHMTASTSRHSRGYDVAARNYETPISPYDNQ